MTLMLSTVTTPERGITPRCLLGARSYASHLPWLVSSGPSVDWITTTIGHMRLRALDHVNSTWTYCLDADDELIAPLPEPTQQATSQLIGVIFDYTEPNQQPHSALPNNRSASHATARAIFRTEWLRHALRDFITTGLIREDLYLMWRLIEDGRIAYVPRVVLAKREYHCPHHNAFAQRNRVEYRTHWDRVMPPEYLERASRLLRKRIIPHDNGIITGVACRGPA